MSTPDGSLPPPEAALIRLARQARGLSPEQAADRTPVKIKGYRWRQIESGYKGKAGASERTIAPARTLAHMAHTVGVAPERLEEAGRYDAAEILREIQRQAAEEAARQAELQAAPYADLADPHERAVWESPADEQLKRQIIDLIRKGKTGGGQREQAS